MFAISINACLAHQGMLCHLNIIQELFNVIEHWRSLCLKYLVSRLGLLAMLSPVCVSVVCGLSVTLVHPTQTVVIFGIFYGVWYLGHPLTFTENFTEIVPTEPLRWGGVKHEK